MVLPINLLMAAQGDTVLIELKDGTSFNGTLVNTDTFMNINLKEVTCTSKEGDKFWSIPECYVRGSTIKYFRLPEEVFDMVPDDDGPAGGSQRPRGGGRDGFSNRGTGAPRGGGGRGGTRGAPPFNRGGGNVRGRGGPNVRGGGQNSRGRGDASRGDGSRGGGSRGRGGSTRGRPPASGDH